MNNVHSSIARRPRLIVIGGGAAGFFCAVNAARLAPGLSVTILEKSNKVLSKVKVSGGGRCNVTHACFSIADMVRRYPRGANFLKKAFHHFFTEDTIAWFGERGVALKTEADGRMFPASNNSGTIIDCLVAELNRYGVELRLQADVRELSRQPETGIYQVQLANGRSLEAEYICVACGGFPKDSMFDWLRPLGHTIEAPVPSLFTFNMPGNPITGLMGVALDAQVRITGSKLQEQGPVLITHWGLSGPAVLRLSAWGARELAAKDYQFSILVNWLPAYNEQSLREKLQQLRYELAGQKTGQRNPLELPQRLWEYLLEQSGINMDTRWADLPAKEQNKLIRNCCAQEHTVKGKTTFKEEFVTAGGIALATVEAGSMQSKLLPGLFFAGEILDVDGVTGGFNFQHAWTSGFIAATSISKLATAE
ncbi:MAG: NAD(P)/FAD-dependent oxidoreductase [Candidatus Pseudobacter hemicellulosilyticus]|uniref:NAD(P)/FAD-dependent oxidoreductase n=1 Tax=Candidatus Pseudobacter hemicellulosilyticus TaxID=3121375 RepID=A0AAJ6BHN4_9BACT|nr:MAG: NAD(P)/FAD-dependent oxidoreductase [Pseudobacter sp.]